MVKLTDYEADEMKWRPELSNIHMTEDYLFSPNPQENHQQLLSVERPHPIRINTQPFVLKFKSLARLNQTAPK